MVKSHDAVVVPAPPQRRVQPAPIAREDSFNRPDSPLFHETLPLPAESAIRRHRQRSRGRQASASSSESDGSAVGQAQRTDNRRQRRHQQHHRRRRIASAGAKTRHSAQIRYAKLYGTLWYYWNIWNLCYHVCHIVVRFHPDVTTLCPGNCYFKSVCLSSVTFVQPTQPVEMFGNVLTPYSTSNSHSLIFLQNFTDIVPREPLRRRLNAREVAKYTDFGPVEGLYLGNDARYDLGYN